MLRIIQFALLVLLMSCSDGYNDYQLRRSLDQRLQEIDASPTRVGMLALDSLTNFAWDKVYFFDEETLPHHISTDIGFEWDGPAVPGFHTRLLFVDKNRVVCYMDYPYADYLNSPSTGSHPFFLHNCAKVPPLKGLNRTEARLVVFRYCKDSSTPFVAVPANCFADFKDTFAERCK